jgi:hypothetical protein
VAGGSSASAPGWQAASTKISIAINGICFHFINIESPYAGNAAGGADEFGIPALHIYLLITIGFSLISHKRGGNLCCRGCEPAVAEWAVIMFLYIATIKIKPCFGV